MWYIHITECYLAIKRMKYWITLHVWFLEHGKWKKLDTKGHIVWLHLQACPVPSCLIVVHFAAIGCFSQMEDCGNLDQASLWALLHPQECTGPLCVSVSHFGHSHKISNFPITAIFIPVISDQSLWLTKSSQWSSIFSNRYIKVCALLF